MRRALAPPRARGWTLMFQHGGQEMPGSPAGAGMDLGKAASHNALKLIEQITRHLPEIETEAHAS